MAADLCLYFLSFQFRMIIPSLIWFFLSPHHSGGSPEVCEKDSPCPCQVSGRGEASSSIEPNPEPTNHEERIENMVIVNESSYYVGTNSPVFESDGESPKREVRVNSFLIDLYEVSNQNFSEFVAKTNYVTEAEKLGNSFVLESLIIDTEVRSQVKQAVASAPWWVPVDGASWKSPEGPRSDISHRMDHPVVHVSWNDANSYCKSIGKRLPTESEWEVACRGGLHDRLFPWGNLWKPNGVFFANTWQGDFPNSDSGEDGFKGTAPVTTFPANKYGLKNMVGNVWEWTSSWWSTLPGDSKNLPNGIDKVKKGGSFMCSKAFCYRHRCAARSFNTPNSSASNLGFRCAADVKTT